MPKIIKMELKRYHPNEETSEVLDGMLEALPNDEINESQQQDIVKPNDPTSEPTSSQT